MRSTALIETAGQSIIQALAIIRDESHLVIEEGCEDDDLVMTISDVEGAGYTRLFSGKITIGNSIAPAGVDWATTFLNGFGQPGSASRIIALPRAEYLALPDPDPSTIDIIED